MRNIITSHVGRLGVAAAATALMVGGTLSAGHAAPESETAQAVAARPVLKVPFPCHEVWNGNTRTNHSPPNAIDFNAPTGGDTDKGRPVKASGAGTVTKSFLAEGEGYGNQVEINHGNGYRSFYAHLEKGSRTVSVGDTVTAGTTIGKVGKSGLNPNEPSETAHLHYEQRKYSDSNSYSVIRVEFGGNPAFYWGTTTYERTVC